MNDRRKQRKHANSRVKGVLLSGHSVDRKPKPEVIRPFCPKGFASGIKGYARLAGKGPPCRIILTP